jgi:hypothetical protein
VSASAKSESLTPVTVLSGGERVQEAGILLARTGLASLMVKAVDPEGRLMFPASVELDSVGLTKTYFPPGTGCLIRMFHGHLELQLVEMDETGAWHAVGAAAGEPPHRSLPGVARHIKAIGRAEEELLARLESSKRELDVDVGVVGKFGVGGIHAAEATGADHGANGKGGGK